MDAKIDDVLDDYIAFYQDRLDRGLQVDRSTCPYNDEMLKDRKAICRNILTNPFEKFERKRFLYLSASKIKPNYMQKKALKELNRYRAAGVNRALTIASAGSGKTYLAAFDALNFNPKRLNKGMRI